MIKATNLTKKFEDFTALSSLSTEINRGRIYGLVGSNGAGKSTFMRLISGVYKPEVGSVTIDGQEVFENVAVKQKVFYLPDDVYYLPKASADDMAKFYSKIYPSFNWELYNELKVHFPIDCGAKINTFSKGKKRQASILVAMCCGCDYILIDEAFDGLDPVIRLMIKKILVSEIEKRNATIIVTSHNLRELEDLCDQVGLIHDGSILFQKDLDDLKLGFSNIQLAFAGDVDIESFGLDIMKKSQKGSVITLTVRGEAEVNREILEKGNPIFCEVVPLTLEEVFIGEMEAVGYDHNNIIF